MIPITDEQRIALHIEYTPLAVIEWEVDSNLITFWNPAAEKIFGYSAEEVVNKQRADIIVPKHELESLEPIWQGLCDESGSYKSINDNITKEGKTLTCEWHNTPLKDASGQIIGIAALALDITDKVQAEQKLIEGQQNAEYQATHDSLTGLANRDLFNKKLNELFSAQQHSENDFAVLFLDLDEFKLINDSLGHFVGDEVLNIVAKRFKNCLRSTDLLARFGGDEFAVLVQNMKDSQGVAELSQRLIDSLVNPIVLDEVIQLSVSIGICLKHQDCVDPQDMLRKADISMYHAKGKGGANFEFFNPALHLESGQRLQKENAIRKAIKEKEFKAYYQPIVSLSSGELLGFEALVRWQHEAELRFPGSFIPLAENNNLIIDIDNLVIEQACHKLAEWQDIAAIDVHINVSGRHFSHTDLVPTLKYLIDSYKLKTELLHIEVTETVLMEHPKAALSVFGQLKDLGVMLYLDDFGTGFSSLGYLQRFPFDGIKLDRSFVETIDSVENKVGAAKSSRLIIGIQQLAKSLDLQLIAEGIETKAQQALLKEWELTQGQGFLFSQAINAELASQIVKSKVLIST